MDIPLDARDAAQAAARREGLSLGEWLTRRILKRYSELSVQEREDSFNQLGCRLTEVADRLDRLEGSARSEPLREAVKKLHQGLGRLSADFVQTTGESTIRVSALSRDLEDMLAKIHEIRETVSRADSGFEQHIEAVQRELHANAQTSERRHDALARKLDLLGQNFGDGFAGLSRSSGALQSEVVRIAQDLQTLDGRVDETRGQTEEHAGRIADKVESFAIRLDRVCAATAESATSLHSRIEDCHDRLGRLDAARSEQSANVVQRLERLDGQIAGSAAEAAEMCGALDSRLRLLQQSLQALDQRHEGTADGLAKGRDWVAEKISETRSQSSSACAALDARVTASRHALDDLERRHGEAAEETRRTQQTALAALQALEGGIDSLGTRLSVIETDSRSGNLERRLHDLVARAESADATLEARRDKIEALDGAFGRLDEFDKWHGETMQALAETRATVSAIPALEGTVATLQTQMAEIKTRGDGIFGRLDNLDSQHKQTMQNLAEARRTHESAASAVQSLESRVAGLQAEFSGFAADPHPVELASQIEELSGRTQALETGLDLVQDHTKVVGDLLTSLDARIAGGAGKQQDGLADLKSELLDELSHSLASQIEAETRKQEQALEELHATFAAQTLRALEEKLEDGGAHNRKVAASAPAADPASAPLHDPLPASEAPPLAATDIREMAPDHAADGSILDLATPAEDAPGPPRHHDLREAVRDGVSPPAFAQPALEIAPAIGGFGLPVGDLPESAMAFANDQAHGSAAGSASFLTAARQSLQDAAQRNDTESRPKSPLGFQFFRASGPRNKGKNDATSYALIAGVVLVAIVAIAVTTTQLVKRSQPVAATRPARTLAIARQATRHPAAKAASTATKPPIVNKTTAAPRLAQLANAGDPQAQLLLGLQEIGANATDAAKWLGAAAQQGMPIAQYRIGTLYAQGRGVPADAAKAFHWYGEAAKGGNRKAMSNLAVDYAQGSGTAKDPQQAALWFSKAAQLGLVDAQFDLAVLYERGLGVPQSLIDAYRWYLVAAKAGDRESKDRVDALASQLSAQDRAAAEAAAAQFKPQPMNASANEPQ